MVYINGNTNSCLHHIDNYILCLMYKLVCLSVFYFLLSNCFHSPLFWKVWDCSSEVIWLSWLRLLLLLRQLDFAKLRNMLLTWTSSYSWSHPVTGCHHDTWHAATSSWLLRIVGKSCASRIAAHVTTSTALRSLRALPFWLAWRVTSIQRVTTLIKVAQAAALLSQSHSSHTYSAHWVSIWIHLLLSILLLVFLLVILKSRWGTATSQSTLSWSWAWLLGSASYLRNLWNIWISLLPLMLPPSPFPDVKMPKVKSLLLPPVSYAPGLAGRLGAVPGLWSNTCPADPCLCIFALFPALFRLPPNPARMSGAPPTFICVARTGPLTKKALFPCYEVPPGCCPIIRIPALISLN